MAFTNDTATREPLRLGMHEHIETLAKTKTKEEERKNEKSPKETQQSSGWGPSAQNREGKKAREIIKKRASLYVPGKRSLNQKGPRKKSVGGGPEASSILLPWSVRKQLETSKTRGKKGEVGGWTESKGEKESRKALTLKGSNSYPKVKQRSNGNFLGSWKEKKNLESNKTTPCDGTGTSSNIWGGEGTEKVQDALPTQKTRGSVEKTPKDAHREKLVGKSVQVKNNQTSQFLEQGWVKGRAK